MSKRGVLLINIGTPDNPTVDSVKKYLREFLLDPDVIDLPAPLRHLLVRGIILQTRPKKTAPKYESVWMDEGAPLRVYTQRMADALQQELENTHCIVGMRYGNPSIESGLKKLKELEVDELLIAPLFPHYAQATTESALKYTYSQLKKIKWFPIIRELGHFPEDPNFINPLSNSIKKYLSEDSHLLFSYHGLPISHIKRIDNSGKHCQKVNACCTMKVNENTNCYAHHCMMTTLSVVKKLGLEDTQWTISYQSRLGPAKWLKPSTKETVEKLKNEGVKKLIIVSPSFLADGLETLEELDIEIRKDFLKDNENELIVVNCLNDDPMWIKGFKQIILRSFNEIISVN
ncbi:MAG: ferrochelatase [Euryarchaeota archaeon]|nr:ferrochelatase [Euryarchaeota archaeon]|tara:strand:+ start:3208 stop:4242 length:1035 start_codon:yes stop_codon:yes gene_type:complete